MGVDHPGSGQEIQKLWRELRRVAKATIQNAAIGRAGLRVYDGGWIRIEDGGLAVTGTETVNGRLVGVEGSVLDWDGNVILRRTLNVVANSAFGGTLDIKGDTTISGDTELQSDLDVTGGGKITAGNVRIEGGKIYAGNMVIDPANGGTVTFPGGAVVKAGSSGGVELTHGSYSAVVTSAGASVGKVGRAIAVTDAVGFQLVGVPATSGKGLPAGTLWADTAGIIYRATS